MDAPPTDLNLIVAVVAGVVAIMLVGPDLSGVGFEAGSQVDSSLSAVDKPGFDLLGLTLGGWVWWAVPSALGIGFLVFQAVRNG